MNSNESTLLAELALLLNSSLSTKEIVEHALQKLRQVLQAEAATVFLKDPKSEELTFWALAGGGTSVPLVNTKMPAGKGIVGWVMENSAAQLVPDVHSDTRFFPVIEQESNFRTRDMICVPLMARGKSAVGAIQVLNRSGGAFSQNDLQLAEQIAPVIALALENAQLFETLEARNKVLVALDRKREQMISLIVHEFQTPLNVVLTSSDLLSSGILHDAALSKQIGETLGKGVLRLSRTVSNMRTISALSSPALELQRSPVKIAPLFDQLSRFFSGPLSQRSLSLEVSAPENLPAVNADPVLLRVLLINLISNAIRFTPDGGKITVSASEGGGFVRIAVQDTGIGIDPAHHEAIFEQFFEVADVLHHSSGEYEFRSAGLGLGLAAAQAIAHAHGAKIEVRSVLGAGSTFTIRLATV